MKFTSFALEAGTSTVRRPPAYSRPRWPRTTNAPRSLLRIDFPRRGRWPALEGTLADDVALVAGEKEGRVLAYNRETSLWGGLAPSGGLNFVRFSLPRPRRIFPPTIRRSFGFDRHDFFFCSVVQDVSARRRAARESRSTVSSSPAPVIKGLGVRRPKPKSLPRRSSIEKCSGMVDSLNAYFLADRFSRGRKTSSAEKSEKSSAGRRVPRPRRCVPARGPSGLIDARAVSLSECNESGQLPLLRQTLPRKEPRSIVPRKTTARAPSSAAHVHANLKAPALPESGTKVPLARSSKKSATPSPGRAPPGPSGGGP